MLFFRHTVLMKLLAVVALFLLLSCGTVDRTKKYPHMVADADPVSAGAIEAEFDRIFSSKLNKIPVEVIFYPRLNAVALEFRYELITYRQFWDEAGRRQFATALEQYKKDYAERNLSGRYRKTRAIYGKTEGRVEWQTFKFAKTRLAFPAIELGYRFREDRPFFATLMQPAREEDDFNDSSPPAESQQISMYFTRAQADDLVKLFDQSYLMGLLGEKDSPKSDEPFDVEFYEEYE